MRVSGGDEDIAGGNAGPFADPTAHEGNARSWHHAEIKAQESDGGLVHSGLEDESPGCQWVMRSGRGIVRPKIAHHGEIGWRCEIHAAKSRLPAHLLLTHCVFSRRCLAFLRTFRCATASTIDPRFGKANRCKAIAASGICGVSFTRDRWQGCGNGYIEALCDGIVRLDGPA